MIPPAKDPEANHYARARVALAATTIIPSTYWSDIEQSPTLRFEPIASFAPRARHGSLQTTSLVTAQEMIASLRNAGLPVSAIADTMRVERKSIYSWLNGGEMRSGKTHRAAKLYRLLTGVAGVDARSLYRFWNTPVDRGRTLRDMLVAESVDETVVASTLNKLRPAAIRARETEQKMSRPGKGNPAIDEIPEAGANA